MPKSKTAVQTFLFSREKWTPKAARDWLKKYGHKIVPVDSTKQYHRFRQEPPFRFQAGTFRTITIGAVSKGIKAVVAVPREPKKSTSKPRKNPPKTKKPVWLPALLVDLADPLTIDLESGEQLKFKRSGNFALCSNRAGTEIWIMSRKFGRNVQASDEQAEKLFERFTGFEHDPKGIMVQVAPKKLIRIGRATSIVYRSDKFSRPGKTTDYIHPFDNYPIVSLDDKKEPSIVALRGGRIQIKQEGITG